MARVPFIGALALSLIALQIMPIGNLRAQVPGTAGHEHLSEVACMNVPSGEKRPEFGCFNIGTVTGLRFSQASVYWHLHAFPSRKAAEAAKSATGIVVEEDGRVWLSEFGPRNSAPRGGKAIAVVGPLLLPAAKNYSAVLSYAVMRPGDSSRVHTHPGPEGWYVLAGEQCLETPAGAAKTQAGGTMTVQPNIPMELNVTGTKLRRAFALVIHDSAQERGIPSDWKPSGACSSNDQKWGVVSRSEQAENGPKSIVLKPGEPDGLAYDAGTVRFLASSDDTNGEWSLVELTEQPGYKTRVHRHIFTDETYYVLTGVLTAKIADKTHELPAGSYILIPHGTPHAQGNLGKVPVKVLLMMTPGGFEGSFKDRAELVKSISPGDPDFVTRRQQMMTEKKYDREYLGDWNPQE